MKSTLCALGAALLLPFAVAAQSVASIGTLAASTPNGGSITYFGTVCTHDCQHEQFARLRRAFATVRPTVVYFQNPDRDTDSTEAATIGEQGESGYVRFLAQQQQVPAVRLDDPLAEYAYLQTRLDPERLKLFYLLRLTQQFQARTGARKSLVKQAMRSYIEHSADIMPGTEGVIRDQAELEAAYRQHCPAGTKWWAAPAAWFNPASTATRLSNPDIERFKQAVQDFRQHTLYSKLAADAQDGQRVLVVLSRDYLPLVPQPSLTLRR